MNSRQSRDQPQIRMSAVQKSRIDLDTGDQDEIFSFQNGSHKMGESLRNSYLQRKDSKNKTQFEKLDVTSPVSFGGSLTPQQQAYFKQQSFKSNDQDLSMISPAHIKPKMSIPSVNVDLEDKEPLFIKRTDFSNYDQDQETPKNKGFLTEKTQGKYDLNKFCVEC